MKKELTLGNLLGILTPIFVLLFGWGISINSRMTGIDNNKDNINKNKTEADIAIERNRLKTESIDDKVDENFKEIIDKLDRINDKL